MGTAIWWIRRDVRLQDNPALIVAAGDHRVIPVFILDPLLLARPAEKRQAFLFDGLRSLADSIERQGGQMVVREGVPLHVLRDLLAETGAEVIWAEEDHTPYARRRDSQVSAALPLKLINGLTIHPPLAVTKADGTPYTVFTPFSKAWKALPLPPPSPAGVHAVFSPERYPSTPLPQLPPLTEFPAGEAEANQSLEDFLRLRVHAYHEDRNRMDMEGTSSLSPYLRFGMLSARVAAAQAVEVMQAAPNLAERRGAETWLNELIWREFYHGILYHFPQVARHAFKPAMRSIPWRDAPDDLLAWQQGQTGYPVVDAAMRQLLQSGWMHNRARMVAASFLVKHLLINWQAGERWFMRRLVDGDLAANNGGWQWTAGVGTDAAPYFRIFNPLLQAEKFDPRGAYIRRWLPELARVPDAYIHKPGKMPMDAQRTAGCLIGQDYPAPIVDHAFARQRALAAYRR